MTTPEDFIQSLTTPVSAGESINIQISDLTQELIVAQFSGKETIARILEGADTLKMMEVVSELQSAIRNVQLTLRRTQLILDQEGGKQKYEGHNAPELDVRTQEKLEILGTILSQVITVLNDKTQS